MMRRIPAVFSLLSLSACAHAPELGAPKAAPVSPVASVPSVPASAPVATSAPLAVAPAEAAPAPPPPDGPKLYLVNELAREGVSLFADGNGAPLAASDAIFSKLGDDGITVDESSSKGFPPMASVLGMAGKYPDSLWLTVSEPRGRSGISEVVFRSAKSGWTRLSQAPRAGEYVGIGNWSNGRVLAARFVERADGWPRYGFQLIAGSPAPLPAFSKPPASARRDPEDPCANMDTLVSPQQLAILPSGHVYGAGVPCNAQFTAVEHWLPGKTQSEITPVPGSEDWSNFVLLPGSDGTLGLLGTSASGATLASFDGKSWSSEKLPIDGDIQHVARAPDGALFALSIDRETPSHVRQPHLWRRSAGQGAFSEYVLPADLDGKPLNDDGMSSLVALGADDAWLFLGGALLHTRPAPSGPRMIDWEQNQQAPAELRAHKLASERCKDLFVLLFPISSSTPADFDFPELRKSLGGHAELEGASLVEAVDNGARYVGAFVADLEQGNALAKLAQKSVSGAKPAVLCSAPKRQREIPVEWQVTERGN